MSEKPVVDVNDAEFEPEVLEREGPVIVAFWAEWCGPCRAATPVLEELAEEFDPDLEVVRVDVDRNPQTPSYYGIKSVPTFLRFVDGEVVDRVVGAVPRPRLAALFES